MTEKNKKLKNLIRFHNANKIDNYNRGRKEGEKKKENKSKRIYRASQKIRIINVFLESLLSESFPSLGFTVHLLSLGCPPTLCWSLDLLRGQLRFLICTYSYVVLPPMSMAIRTSAFSFVGALSGLLYIPQTQSLPSWSCGFNLQLVQMVGGFESSSLPTLPLGFNCGFISTSACGSSTGVCSWGCLRGLGSAPVRARCGGGAAAWVAGVLAAPGTQGGWRLGQQEIQCSRRVWQPALANTLQYSCLENSPDGEA